MENTFFNIVQETTHQENDFLRVGKKFIQAEQLWVWTYWYFWLFIFTGNLYQIWNMKFNIIIPA